MERSLTSLKAAPLTSDVVGTTLTVLRAALDGSGPAVAPSGPGRAAPSSTVPDEIAVVVRTSGSTGLPRHVLLGRAALVASAAATHERLGGTGRWVLALPLDHVAGLQVLVRSLVAGTSPVVVPSDGGFRPDALAEAVRLAVRDRGTSGRLYASLVPTQLHRIVSAWAGSTVGGDLEPLRALDAVLVGGAAAGPALVGRARALGLNVVETYGMTETAGGCVYDGVPLRGVRVQVRDDVVHVAGPVLAHGYLGGDDDAFWTDDEGTRWFRTSDQGRLDGGTLRVTGRRDDVLVTGGHKVAPAAVEAVLSGMPGIADVCVVGVPDAEWGQVVVAVVVPSTGPVGPVGPTRPGGPAEASLERLRAEVTRTLGSRAAPRHVVLVDELPRRGPGKIDRAAVAAWALERLAGARATGSRPVTPEPGASESPTIGTEHDGHSS